MLSSIRTLARSEALLVPIALTSALTPCEHTAVRSQKATIRNVSPPSPLDKPHHLPYPSYECVYNVGTCSPLLRKLPTPPPNHQQPSQPTIVSQKPVGNNRTTHPVPSSVGRRVPPLRRRSHPSADTVTAGSTAAPTTTTTAAHGRAKVERGHRVRRRCRGSGGGGGGSGGSRRVVGENARAVPRPLGRAAAQLGAVAAARRTPRGEVDHIVEPVRRAETGTAALFAVSRALQAAGLSAAGVLRVSVFGFLFCIGTTAGGGAGEGEVT